MSNNKDKAMWYLTWNFDDVHVLKKILSEAECGRLFLACMHIAENGSDPEPAPEWQSDIAPALYAMMKSKAIAAYKKVHKDPVKQENGSGGGKKSAKNNDIRKQNEKDEFKPVWSCKNKKEFMSKVFEELKANDYRVPREVVAALYDDLLFNNWRVGNVPIKGVGDCVALLSGNRNDDEADNRDNYVPNLHDAIYYVFENCNGFRYQSGDSYADLLAERFFTKSDYTVQRINNRLEIMEWKSKLLDFANTFKTEEWWYDVDKL